MPALRRSNNESYDRGGSHTELYDDRTGRIFIAASIPAPRPLGEPQMPGRGLDQKTVATCGVFKTSPEKGTQVLSPKGPTFCFLNYSLHHIETHIPHANRPRSSVTYDNDRCGLAVTGTYTAAHVHGGSSTSPSAAASASARTSPRTHANTYQRTRSRTHPQPARTHTTITPERFCCARDAIRAAPAALGPLRATARTQRPFSLCRASTPLAPTAQGAGCCCEPFTL